MDQDHAVAALAALAHPHRLGVFRLLVVEGEGGVSAGAIAEAVGMTATAASFHLKELERAGLIQSSRKGRYIHYALAVDGIHGLLTYLTNDCCQGRPELCGMNPVEPSSSGMASKSHNSTCCSDTDTKEAR
jgi:ArsR family transcriptional regulator, arsenate/arsenite/antimonite-responsive transcriptional repressor